MTKSKGFDWMPTIIMVGCFVLVPGGGFFLGVLCSTLYYLGRFVLDLAADAEEEDKKQTKSKHTHTGPLLPKPRPNVTRNDS